MKETSKRRFHFQLIREKGSASASSSLSDYPWKFSAHAVACDDVLGVYQIAGEDGEVCGEIPIDNVRFWLEIPSIARKGVRFRFCLHEDDPFDFNAHGVVRDDVKHVYNVIDKDGELCGEIPIKHVLFWHRISTTSD